MSDAFEVIADARDEANWLELRKLGVGASEAATLLGANPWKSQLQLYAEKIAAVEPDDLSDNEAVQWGKRLEAVIIDAYRDRTGRFVDAGGKLLRSTRYPWALCTLDAWTATEELGPYWPLEAKAVGLAKGGEWVDGPPEHYRIQMMWQMLVTNKPRATGVALIGGQKLVWCDVERDETLVRKLVYHGEEFWARVQRREPPSPDGSDGSRRAIHAMFPDDDGETIVLPGVLLDAADELETIKLEEKALYLRKVRAENDLKMALGPAERGALPDGRIVSWKTQVRKAYQVTETKNRVLRVTIPKGK
jgi:putative phage-type endonuclease